MYRSLLLLLPVAVLAAGCSRPASPTGSRLSTPEKGTARLMPVKIEESPTRVHYQWSILGERNWVTPSVTAEGKASLAEVYPLNDPRRSGGCPTWLCDAILVKQDAQWQWELRLHGSNGKTAAAHGAVSGSETVTVLLPRDTQPTLPAALPLVQLGTTQLTLALPQ